jgi:hypothetical protein
MKFEIRPYLQHWLARHALLVLALAWAGYSSFMAARNKPEVVLIGFDGNGARIIQSQNDPLLLQERTRFVKDVLFRLYNYDAESYAQRISSAGHLMSDAAWVEQEKTFKKTVEQMKTRSLRAEAKLLDLRELDEQNFEADVSVRITERLVTHEVRMRITLSIGPRKRNVENPYAWEVTTFHENELH